MGKILVSSSHFEELCQGAKALLLEAGHEIVLHKGELPYMSFAEIAAVAPEIDGAIIGLDDWTEEVFQLAPKLKVVAKFGVGTDNIDKEAAKRHGIKVINAPGMNSNAVAELTVGLMIDMLRQVTSLHTAMTRGQWPRFMGGELEGRTIGLLGFGAIARLVAKKLQGFDVRLIASDLYPNRELAEKYGVEILSSEEVIAQSDILSIHVPSTPQTYHMFNQDTFARMKRGACLVNAARGSIIDTQALVDALHSGQIACAALDAFENEPLSAEDPLLLTGKVICTPHTGAETKESYHRVSMCVAQGVVDVLNGKEPQFCVNR